MKQSELSKLKLHLEYVEEPMPTALIMAIVHSKVQVILKSVRQTSNKILNLL